MGRWSSSGWVMVLWWWWWVLLYDGVDEMVDFVNRGWRSGLEVEDAMVAVVVLGLVMVLFVGLLVDNLSVD